MWTTPTLARRNFISSALEAVAAFLTFGSASLASAAQRKEEKQGTRMPEHSLDSLYDTSVSATGLTGEAADRLAIRRLVDAWAHCADRRLAQQQADLFTPDGVVNNYTGDPESHKPVSILRGRQEIVTALAVLKKYSKTFHFNGQSDVAVAGDHADGESYCMAHQLWEEGGQHKLQVLAIRYRDKFVRESGKWYFAERNLIIDWADTRATGG